MRIKIFSHSKDPDGIGSIILAKLVNFETDYTLCENPNHLDLELQRFLENKDLEQYERVYITDLCPSNQILEELKDRRLEDKVYIFDHHLTSINQSQTPFKHLTNMEKKDGIPCCGTSLFYEHLVQEGFDFPSNTADFVELTRLHDTWEWKKNKNFTAYHLETILGILGAEKYLHHYFKKILTGKNMQETKEEQGLIEQKEQETNQKILELMNKIIKKEEKMIYYGIVDGPYEYRNILAEKCKELRKDLDILILLAYDKNSISFRSLKEITVNELAEYYGGGGHPLSAAAPLTKENEILIKSRFM